MFGWIFNGFGSFFWPIFCAGVASFCQLLAFNRLAFSGQESMGCGGIAPRQQFIKNQNPQKVSPNLKKTPPERPNVDLGVIFGAILALIFDENLDFVVISENHPNAYI